MGVAVGDHQAAAAGRWLRRQAGGLRAASLQQSEASRRIYSPGAVGMSARTVIAVCWRRGGAPVPGASETTPQN